MKKLVIAAMLSFVMGLPAYAQVQIDDPWVRATVPQQRTTGAFLRIVSVVDARLVEVRSPAAAVVEIHEMKMENDVMKMRAVQALDLPAGQVVELKPGGYHVMLFDLKAQVREGDTVPLTLVIEGENGKREEIKVGAPARPLNQPMHHRHGHEQKHQDKPG